MKTIAFYISDHGFGHINRNIPIIKKILDNSNDINIIVKCGNKHVEFMKSLLQDYYSKIKYYEENTDVGLILKEGSIEVDKNTLKIKLYEFVNSWQERSEKEKEFLQDNNVSLMISDVVPWIFTACKHAKVKSILMSNFTWVEIYKELFEEEYLYKSYINSYSLADETWIYSLSGYIKEYAQNPKFIGLCCRDFHDGNIEEIRNEFKEPIVFVSVGRSVQLTESINVENLPYSFIYTDGINLKGKNTYKLPVETLNTQDYIKASDYVITKAGWSTISEAICSRKPIIVIDRKEVAEDRKTIEKLLNLDIAITIKNNEFNSENIDRLLREVSSKRENYLKISDMYNNQSHSIAKKLLDTLCK